MQEMTNDPTRVHRYLYPGQLRQVVNTTCKTGEGTTWETGEKTQWETGEKTQWETGEKTQLETKTHMNTNNHRNNKVSNNVFWPPEAANIPNCGNECHNS